MKTKIDWIMYISFILILLSMILFAYHNYTEKVNECTSDPLRFAVEKIMESRDAESVYGYINVIKDNQLTSWDFGDEINYLNISR